jgi:hypothetical protein
LGVSSQEWVYRTEQIGSNEGRLFMPIQVIPPAKGSPNTRIVISAEWTHNNGNIELDEKVEKALGANQIRAEKRRRVVAFEAQHLINRSITFR